MNEQLVVILVLGVLMGGSILVIDSVIIRRLRRRRDQDQDQDRRHS